MYIWSRFKTILHVLHFSIQQKKYDRVRVSLIFIIRRDGKLPATSRHSDVGNPLCMYAVATWLVLCCSPGVSVFQSLPPWIVCFQSLNIGLYCVMLTCTTYIHTWNIGIGGKLFGGMLLQQLCK